MPALPIDTDQIVITASRAPESEAQTPASVTIIDQQRIERLDEPLVSALLRLTPSAAVTTSGPGGSLTEVRIRGAEANHSLLFVDGIKVNDPASGDTPRFELLNADLASRIEIVRGPQSALWGSEAIGGVIAVNGLDDAAGEAASGEVGSFGFARASASASRSTSRAALSGALGFQRATGIDSFNGSGDKDGYRNLSGRLRATWHPSPAVELGASGLALTGRSEFDGFDPVTFAHTDTLDSSRNRLAAGRIWANIGEDSTPWHAQIAGSLLGSSNRNLLAGVEQNRTRGDRRSLTVQIERRFSTGAVSHRLIAAADAEGESFHARDTTYGGLSNQDRNRSHHALTVEWRAQAKMVTGDVAVRRDMFNRFHDATSLRASLLAQVGGGLAVAGSYGEGIAQPTFGRQAAAALALATGVDALRAGAAAGRGALADAQGCIRVGACDPPARTRHDHPGGFRRRHGTLRSAPASWRRCRETVAAADHGGATLQSRIRRIGRRRDRPRFRSRQPVDHQAGAL